MSHAMLSRQLGLPLRLAIRERESGIRDPHSTSRRTSSHDGERVGRSYRRSPGVQYSQNAIEHRVQFLREVLGQKTQHKIAVLLQQPVLASIASVGGRIR